MVKVVNQKSKPAKGAVELEKETKKVQKNITKDLGKKEDRFGTAVDLAMDNIKASVKLRELDAYRSTIASQFYDYPMPVSRAIMSRVEDELRELRIEIEARTRAIKDLVG